MGNETLIVFDGDDTLWATEPLYDRARRRVRRSLDLIGLDGKHWELVERKIDLDQVQTRGFAWHRFPRSCALALRETEPRIPKPVRLVIEAWVFAVAASVFAQSPQVAPDAEQVLCTLARSSRIALLTKGQPWIQRHRIRQSGLKSYFATCLVVQQKTVESFVRMARGERLKFAVGNSLASDIEPAVRAGYIGIHIDGYMWEHESRPTTTPVTVNSVRSLSAALEVIYHFRHEECASLPA